VKITTTYLRQVIKEEIEKVLEGREADAEEQGIRDTYKYFQKNPGEDPSAARRQKKLDNTAETRAYTQAITRYTGDFPPSVSVKYGWVAGQPEDLETIKAFEAEHGGVDGAFEEVEKRQAENYGAARSAPGAPLSLSPEQKRTLARRRRRRDEMGDL
tara:strand:- start:43 stop:513 length:471 start_codon:yes stop_codon:yes gene_type:complete